MQKACHTISPQQPWFSVPFSTRASCCLSQRLLCNKPPQDLVLKIIAILFDHNSVGQKVSPSYILTFFILFLPSFLSSFAGFTSCGCNYLMAELWLHGLGWLHPCGWWLGLAAGWATCV